MLFSFHIFTWGQNKPLTLTLQQAETLFINNNLELIAERLNIDLAEAAIIQAGV